MLSAAERSHPTSKVRSRSREDQTATAEEQARGATPHPRSGWVAERRYPASEVRGGGWEEISHAPKPEARGSWQEEIPHIPSPRPRAAAGRSNPMPEARAGGREDQPQVQGAVAARCRRA